MKKLVPYADFRFLLHSYDHLPSWCPCKEHIRICPCLRQRTRPELEVGVVVGQPPEEDPDVGLSPQITRSDHKP